MRQVDDRVWKKLYNTVRKVDGASVRVGVPDGELADIAAIHEYGAPKANIPQRSFVRQTFQRKRPELIALQARLAAGIMTGALDERRAMALLGMFMAGAIKATILSDGTFAPLKPSTIKAKGSSKPLVDTAQLSQSITWVVTP
jgi:hypothetical protein